MWDILEVTHEGANKNKEKWANKKAEKKGIVQDNDDSSSRSSSKENGKTYLCLMAKEESESSSVSSNSSTSNFKNYSQLIDAFKEIHEETNMLVLVNNQLKGLNNLLENRVKNLKEELSHSKTDFETLEMICQNSYCKCVDSSF